MNREKQDLTQGRLGKQILFFSLPLMISNVLQVLFNMSDIAVVGRFAGSAALGAVGSTTILVTLFTGFLIGVGTGVNVLVARCFGARSEKDTRATVHTSLLIMGILGLMLLALGELFATQMLRLLNTKEELLKGAALYLRIYFLGMPAMAIYNFGNAVYSAVGNTRKPLYYLLAAGILNVLLNLFFVIVCRLDVAGVAIASAASQCLSAFLIVRALHREEGMHSLRFREVRLDARKAREILALGVPSGGQNAIFAIANLFIQAGVNSFDATVVAGNAAAANADGLIYNVMAAFYTACASFMSQNLGAGRRERVIRSYFISLGYSFFAGGILGMTLLLFGRPFLSLFTNDPAVAQAGMERLTIMSFSYAVSALMDCTIAASRGLGKSVVPMIIVIMGSCVFRVAWVYTVFTYFRTITSLYLLYIFSWTITGVAEALYFARCYRRIAPGITAPTAV